MRVYDGGIESIEVIEAFSNTTSLFISSDLTDVDVSNKPNLNILKLPSNELTSIDASHN
tara:strand:+ start:355 stop:531 length:177 start_codon:yes stop_codon:yes gene_type:complete